MEWSPEVEAFLDEPRYGVLATINPDGSPHQTVMWYRRSGGVIIMNSRKGRQKPLNLEHDARASLCVEDGERYVTLTGRIEIDDDREKGIPDMRIMTERYEGPAKADELMRTTYSKQHRIILTLIPDKVDVHGFS
ncbi:MAG: PPOX class F420-dependent oxidoreductase [Thermomicrobiales bacterium]